MPRTDLSTPRTAATSRPSWSRAEGRRSSAGTIRMCRRSGGIPGRDSSTNVSGSAAASATSGCVRSSRQPASACSEPSASQRRTRTVEGAELLSARHWRIILTFWGRRTSAPKGFSCGSAKGYRTAGACTTDLVSTEEAGLHHLYPAAVARLSLRFTA